MTGRRTLDLDGLRTGRLKLTIPGWEAFAQQIEDAVAAGGEPDADLVAKVEALLESPHEGERAAARAALRRLRGEDELQGGVPLSEIEREWQESPGRTEGLD